MGGGGAFVGSTGSFSFKSERFFWIAPLITYLNNNKTTTMYYIFTIRISYNSCHENKNEMVDSMTF